MKLELDMFFEDCDLILSRIEMWFYDDSDWVFDLDKDLVAVQIEQLYKSIKIRRKHLFSLEHFKICLRTKNEIEQKYKAIKTSYIKYYYFKNIFEPPPRKMMISKFCLSQMERDGITPANAIL
jgi:hypothetical protein